MNRFQVGQRAPLFFMHIPKTAGTSLRRFLADQYAAQDVCPACDWDSLAELGCERLESFRLVQGHFDISLLASIAPAVKTLTLLRHPLNRTLSAIRHMKRDPDFHPLHSRVRDMSVREILEDPNLFPQFQNAQTATLSGACQPGRILEYISAGRQHGERRDPADCKSDPDLTQAMANLARFDFLGIVEDIKPLIADICDKMGYHPAGLFRRDNAAPDGLSNFASLSSRETELLRRCNDLDLPLYEFAKDLIAQRAAMFKPRSIHNMLRGLCEAGIYAVQRDSFRIDLAGPIPGSGWYEPEQHGTIARWTGPSNQFSLDLPLSGAARFRASMHFHAPQKLAEGSLLVQANGVTLPHRVARMEDSYELTFDIPQAIVQAAEDSCQIVLTLPGTFKPNLAGSADLRRLGVLVSAIVFEAL